MKGGCPRLKLTTEEAPPPHLENVFHSTRMVRSTDNSVFSPDKRAERSEARSEEWRGEVATRVLRVQDTAARTRFNPLRAGCPDVDRSRGRDPRAEDLKEAIATVIYTAGRNTELPELGQIRQQFAAKYGEGLVGRPTTL